MFHHSVIISFAIGAQAWQRSPLAPHSSRNGHQPRSRNPDSYFFVGLLIGGAVAGTLIGALLGCVFLALFMSNPGGARDNAKKCVEEGHYGGKGSETHSGSLQQNVTVIRSWKTAVSIRYSRPA